ncbi:MAG TPA: hypothetical protein VHE55_06100 [Fimbriimonadaceae bacterium]|nr:hypothetical protein [Fimbriimonadaceae bacterium]
MDSDPHLGLDEEALRAEGYRRHKNPDGSLGGWVSPDSKVAGTVHLGPGVEVDNQSNISGNVRILDDAHVDNSDVSGNVVIKDRAFVSGCIVKDKVELSGRTQVFGMRRPLRNRSNIVLTGQTQIRNLAIGIHMMGHSLAVSGGTFELPQLYMEIAAKRSGLAPELTFAGNYDKETGKVSVDGVGFQWTSEGIRGVVPLDNEKQLLPHIAFSIDKGLDLNRVNDFTQLQGPTFAARTGSEAKDRRGR